MRRPPLALPAALASALMACVPAAPAPEFTPPPPVAVAPPPVRPSLPTPADPRPRALTPGEWRYGTDAGGTVARFGSGRVTVRCDRSARQIVVATGAPGSITVRTSSASRTLPASTEARLAAADPLLDAIAFSRGQFTLEQAGQAPLVLPAHAEIARVVEDCRG